MVVGLTACHRKTRTTLRAFTHLLRQSRVIILASTRYLLAGAYILLTNSVVVRAEDPTQQLQELLSESRPVLDSLTVHKAGASIPASFADLVTTRGLAFSIVKSPRAPTAYDTQWTQRSLQGATRTLTEKTALPVSERGFAFGVFDVLLKETPDTEQVARKLLWNIVGVQEMLPFLHSQFTLEWGANEDVKSVTGEVLRMRSGILSSGVQSLRELLLIREPAWLSTFKTLTFREYGNADDYFWIVSPTLKKTRQLLPNLRSEGLFGSLLSLDDLFGFSGKPELQEAKLGQRGRMLIPYLSSRAFEYVSAREPERCVEARNTLPKEAFPANIVLTARESFTLELTHRDPFSLVGRKVLYVDSGTMVPWYSEEYNQRGRLEKRTLILSELIGDERLFPSMPIVIALYAFGEDQKDDSATWWQERVRACTQLPSDVTTSLFDPGRLLPATPSPANKKDANPKK